MIYNFVISNLNLITFIVWAIFLIIVALRFFRPNWFKNISFLKLVLIAVLINILYGVFVSWGQYHVWATALDYTKTFVNTPLSVETPMDHLEWMRPLFQNKLGYFMHYIWIHFWFDILITFGVSFLLYYVFKTWKTYRGSFLEQGPELLLVLMLIVGWRGILFLVPIGFILSVLMSIFYMARGKKVIRIEPAFIVASFIAFGICFVYSTFVLSLL